MAINQLIANPQVPNFLGAISGGLQARQQLQAGDLAMQTAQQEQAKRNRLLQMQSEGASASELSQAGFIDEAAKVAQIKSTLSKTEQEEVDRTIQQASALTKGMDQTQFQQAIQSSTLFDQDDKQTLLQLGPEGLQRLAGSGVDTSKNILKIREETRGQIRKDVSGIAKEMDVVKTNWGKLKNLTAEIDKGNRNAVPQALVALVKLGDPGSIVSQNEMIAALNQKDPVAAVAGLLTSKGVNNDVTSSIVAKLDPLDPTNVTTSDILSTGNAMVSAFVPNLQRRLSTSEELAQQNLSSEGINSLFTQSLRDDVAELSNLLDGGKGDLTPEEMEELRRLEAELNGKS